MRYNLIIIFINLYIYKYTYTQLHSHFIASYNFYLKMSNSSNIVEYKEKIKMSPTSSEIDDVLYNLKSYCSNGGYFMMDKPTINHINTFISFAKNNFEKDNVITKYS